MVVCLPKTKIWLFPKIRGKPPKWMVKISWKNPMNKCDDLGGFTTPIFGSAPISPENRPFDPITDPRWEVKRFHQGHAKAGKWEMIGWLDETKKNVDRLIATPGVWIYIYVYMYVYIYIYICIYVCVYIYMYICMCIYIYMYICDMWYVILLTICFVCMLFV